MALVLTQLTGTCTMFEHGRAHRTRVNPSTEIRLAYLLWTINDKEDCPRLKYDTSSTNTEKEKNDQL